MKAANPEPFRIRPERPQEGVVRRNPAILFTDLDDVVVMMDPDKGVYHELNAVGSEIWRLLERPRSAEEICELVLDEFEVMPETARRDVLAFLNRAFELRIMIGASAC